jgi:hypothetical protein
MAHRVALVRTDGSEELIASIIWSIRIGELGTTLTSTNNRSTPDAKKYYVSPIVFLRSVLLFLVAVNVVPSWPIFGTLMMEIICSSET